MHRELDAQTATLAVAGLSQRFGDYQAPIDASSELRGNEILGIIGPNGTSKTTLMECLAGLLPATVDKVRIRGEP